MSVKQMCLVWELDLPHNQAWVLMAYADHADHDGEHVHPSIGKIAWKTGYSPRQIQRIVKALEASGLMELVRHRKGGRGIFPLYRLTLEKGVKKSPFQNHDISERVTSDTEKGDILTQKGDTAMAYKPSLDPSREPKDSRARGKRQSHTHDDAPPTPAQQDEAIASVKPLLDKMLGRSMPPAEEEVAAVQARKAAQLARAKAAGVLG